MPHVSNLKCKSQYEWISVQCRLMKAGLCSFMEGKGVHSLCQWTAHHSLTQQPAQTKTQTVHNREGIVKKISRGRE